MLDLRTIKIPQSSSIIQMTDNVSTSSRLDGQMNIRSIVWPIFIEHSVRMSMMAVDTLMLSQFSGDAVAAVGLTGQFIFFLIIMYMVVSTGTAVLMGQYLGAGKTSQAESYAQAGFTLSVIMAVFVGALFYFGSTSVVSWYQLELAVHRYATQYLVIVGTFSIGISISVLFSSVLRAYGYSRVPMYIQVASGLVNVAGNYIALFGPFGIPITGVVGVAVATVVSQGFAMIVSLMALKGLRLNFSLRQSFNFDKTRSVEIFKLGLPSAAEGLSYNLAQVVILVFVAGLGTSALAAVAIAFTISRFIFVFSLSLGSGAQIISSYMIGKNRAHELKADVHRYWMLGISVSLCLSLAFMLARLPVAALFTDDIEIQQLITTLLVVAVFLEPGRAVNLVVISALKGAGDVVFPVQVGIVSMWGVGVVMAWALGIHWAWGLAGIWFGVALDEWLRAVVMIKRWQKESWMKAPLVHSEAKEI